jgi:chitin disaccharide deacetylase
MRKIPSQKTNVERFLWKLSLSLCITGFCIPGVAQEADSPEIVAKRYPEHSRLLVIQAEDLGMAHSIDKASFEALEKGWVTSAGILVPGPWFPEVLRWSRSHPNGDLGIRLDLNADWSSYRWRPISNVPKESGLTDPGGYLSSSQTYVAQHASTDTIEGEARAQIDMAKRAGIPITHLDNHMRTLVVSPKMFQSYWKMGEEYGLPIVLPNELVKSRGTPSEKPGIYKFGGIDVDIHRLQIDRELEIMPGMAKQDWLSAYEKTLEALPPGVYLLSVHLGYNDDELQAMTWDHPNWGAEWRQNDLDVVSSPEFQKFLKDQGFILVNWKDLKKALPDPQK